MFSGLLKQACINLKERYPDEIAYLVRREEYDLEDLPAGEVRCAVYDEVVRLFKRNVTNNIKDKKLRKFLHGITDFDPCIESMDKLSDCHTVKDIGEHPDFTNWLEWVISAWTMVEAAINAEPFKYTEFEPYILATNSIGIIQDYAVCIRKERWPEGEVRIRYLLVMAVEHNCTVAYYCKQFNITREEFGNG